MMPPFPVALACKIVGSSWQGALHVRWLTKWRRDKNSTTSANTQEAKRRRASSRAAQFDRA